MEVFIYFTLVVAAILVTNMSSGSYLRMEVSSNPILTGLTRTLIVSCYIRDDSFSAAPGSSDDIDTNVTSPTSVKINPSQWTTIPPINAAVRAINAPTTDTNPNPKPQLHVTSSPIDVSHLMSIVITKRNSPGDDETVAEVTPYGPPAAEGSYIGKLQVNGSVFPTLINGERGYLSLIWPVILDDPVGIYTCEATALTHSAHSVTLTGSLGIQARQPEVEDLVPLVIGSYLRMDVSSNPILRGLTKTLTMACYIRDDIFRPAPGIIRTVEPGIIRAIEPITNNDLSITTSDWPTITSDLPLIINDFPVTTTDLQISTSDLPIETSSLPLTNTDLQLTTTDLPISTYDLTITISDLPITTSDLPITDTDLPITTNDLPITTTDFPITTSDWPITTSNWLITTTPTQTATLTTSTTYTTPSATPTPTKSTTPNTSNMPTTVTITTSSASTTSTSSTSPTTTTPRTSTTPTSSMSPTISTIPTTNPTPQTTTTSPILTTHIAPTTTIPTLTTTRSIQSETTITSIQMSTERDTTIPQTLTTETPRKSTWLSTTPLTTTTSTTQKPQLQVTSSSAEVSHLMSIVITKTNSQGESETIAQVTPYDPPEAEGTYVSIVQVNGSVFHTQVNGELGFLSLIWTAPLDDQDGTYTCEANALTHSGHLVTLTESLEIQARQPNIADLVPLIINYEDRIALLEQENQELKHELDLLAGTSGSLFVLALE